MDTLTAFNNLQLDMFFVDGDTRAVTIKNPNTADETLSTKISELNTFIQTNNLLIGDKTGATFGRIRQGKLIRGTKRQLDLNSDD